MKISNDPTNHARRLPDRAEVIHPAKASTSGSGDSSAIHLIVNADDLGLSEATNAGIVRARQCGMVTSASLMVRMPAAAQAVSMIRDDPGLSVGLHVDLGEWAFRTGHWVARYEVTSLKNEMAVRAEVARQLDKFQDMVGRPPTHLDSHQHVHRKHPVGNVLIHFGQMLGVPVRHRCPHVRYCGDFFGQSAEGFPLPNYDARKSLLRAIERLGEGVTELVCHPGLDPHLDTVYVRERFDEVRALCDPEARKRIQDRQIRLLAFHDVANNPVTANHG